MSDFPKRNLVPFTTTFAATKPGVRQFTSQKGSFRVPENCIYPKAFASGKGENGFIFQQLCSGILRPSWVAWFDADETT